MFGTSETGTFMLHQTLTAETEHSFVNWCPLVALITSVMMLVLGAIEINTLRQSEDPSIGQFAGWAACVVASAVGVCYSISKCMERTKIDLMLPVS